MTTAPPPFGEGIASLDALLAEIKAAIFTANWTRDDRSRADASPTFHGTGEHWRFVVTDFGYGFEATAFRTDRGQIVKLPPDLASEARLYAEKNLLNKRP